MPRLCNKEFLTQLESCLAEIDGSNSVYLTQKRLVASLDSAPKDQPTDLSSNVIEHPEKYNKNTRHYPVLVRFSTGSSNSKISTVIEAENLDSFWIEYFIVLRNGFTGLKESDNKEKKKKKYKVSKA
ncbi:signal recognition particle, SRP9/SRP14 subunit [Metschnikowia bicuspidata]|uniref:Signal recognition particle subunit SRP14 n=1 Tax=Metschnikowia bicuspidata TaxID=27322 RepID=A0A4P9ZIL8_9ASCO|nr:signal recognition particle, SRP9/SRP14 subunit [Metschnikowia bicuspidata]